MPASPHFFIVRQDGTKTPLIAVDELPSNFHILGVPPSITDAQTQGMVSLGLVPSSGRCYIIEQDEKSPTSSAASLGPSTQSDSDKHGPGLPRKYTAPNVGLGSLFPAQHPFNDSHEQCGPSSSSYSYDRNTASGAKWCHSEPHVNETQAIIDAVTRLSSETSAQQAQQVLEHPVAGFSHPARGKKIYCNYWLRKGECDYMQQGCLYKHEMPLDKATLASLGLREVPRWYREQWSSVSASTRTQRDDHVNRPWRAPESTSSFSNVQPDASTALPPALTNTEPTQVRQIRVLPSMVPPSTAIRSQKAFEMSEQRKGINSNNTIDSTTQSWNGSNGSRLGTPKRINRAQPVQPGRITPKTPTTPNRATKPVHHTPDSRSRKERDHSLSSADPVAAIPIMMPSQAPLEHSLQETPGHVSSIGTYHPGVLRTASPAHPRLFVRQGQEKFASNPPVEVVERSKTAVSHKANIRHIERESSKTLNIFGDLGV